MFDHLKSKEIVVNQGSLPWIENTKHTITTLFECGHIVMASPVRAGRSPTRAFTSAPRTPPTTLG